MGNESSLSFLSRCRIVSVPHTGPSPFAPCSKSKCLLAYAGAQINATAKAFTAAGLALLFENELMFPGSLPAPSLYLTKCFHLHWDPVHGDP